MVQKERGGGRQKEEKDRGEGKTEWKERKVIEREEEEEWRGKKLLWRFLKLCSLARMKRTVLCLYLPHGWICSTRERERGRHVVSHGDQGGGGGIRGGGNSREEVGGEEEREEEEGQGRKRGRRSGRWNMRGEKKGRRRMRRGKGEGIM